MSTKYQPHIDGLRAVAVISVLLFHLGYSKTAGGYVGVDVFFVISGFLITRLIVAEREARGSFSFANFYVRRIRRIFPALFVTTLVSFIASAVLLSPEMLQPMGLSVLATVFSMSNILFWWTTGYFDCSATMQTRVSATSNGSFALLVQRGDSQVRRRSPQDWNRNPSGRLVLIHETLRSIVPPSLSIIQIQPGSDRIVLVAEPAAPDACRFRRSRPFIPR